MKFPFATFPTLFLFLLLGGCTGEKDVAGGVDGNPNFLQGSIQSAYGAPLEQVPVVLFSHASTDLAKRTGSTTGDTTWQPLDTSWTDAAGQFRFALDTDGFYRLEVRLGDTLLWSEEIDYRAATGYTAPQRAIPLPCEDGILVDDFELPGQTTYLGRWFSDASPWLLAQMPQSDEFSVEPTTALTEPRSARILCDESQNYCLHFHVSGSDDGDAALMLYNTLRSFTQNGIALPSAQTLQVRAKGTGLLKLGVSMQSLLDSKDYTAVGEFSLTSQWQIFNLYFNGYTVQDLMVQDIRVGLNGNGELWIDDVRITGATYWELH